MRFFSALQLALIVLKLAGVINWRWVAVLAPAMACCSLFLILAMLMVWLEMSNKGKEDSEWT